MNPVFNELQDDPIGFALGAFATLFFICLTALMLSGTAWLVGYIINDLYIRMGW